MITDIRLQQFRSYADESFELADGVNIIVGPNASGKTNLLEAIMLIALGNSYRGGDDELVMYQKDWARLDAHTKSGERTVKLEAHNGRLRKTFEISGKAMMRLPLANTLPVVLFEPNHLLLLHGGPELRREFLDNLLSNLLPEYEHIRRHYKRALAQRNSLLKQPKSATKQNLFVWNLRLSELGGKIVEERLKLIGQISAQIEKLYQNLSHTKTKVQLEYQASCSPETYASSLLKKLEASMATDLARGFTAYGPHRDDLTILLNRHPADEAASRGEVRTLVLALKMIELDLVESHRNQKPILLLDDVFSELDGARRRALTDFLREHQTFITTTDADVVVQHFMNNCNIIPMGKP